MSKRIYNLSKTSALLLLLGIVLLLSAIGLSIHQNRSNQRANAAARKAVALANQGQPSPAPATIKPSSSAITNYTVPATHPRYLIVNKLGLRARVLPVGITKAGAIGTPGNVYDSAWYTASNLPGQPGATLIDGHVSSWTTHGVFYNLKLLKTGDQMQIVLGNGTVLRYEVVKLQTYAAAATPVSSLLSSIVPGKSGLNLVTCSGDVIKGSNEFNYRLVVYSVLQP